MKKRTIIAVFVALVLLLVMVVPVSGQTFHPYYIVDTPVQTLNYTDGNGIGQSCYYQAHYYYQDSAYRHLCFINVFYWTGLPYVDSSNIQIGYEFWSGGKAHTDDRFPYWTYPFPAK